MKHSGRLILVANRAGDAEKADDGARAGGALSARALRQTEVYACENRLQQQKVMRVPYTESMRLPDRFLLFAVPRRTAARLLAMVMLVLGLAAAVDVGAVTVEQSVLGEAPAADSSVPVTPGHTCFKRHGCEPGAAASAHAGALPLDQSRHSVSPAPDFPAPLAPRLAAPPAATPLFLLFRNFRE